MSDQSSNRHQPERGGMTDLQFAAASGDMDWIRVLLQEGVDVNAVNQGGMSALHSAALVGSVDSPREEVLRLLLQSGADPNLRDMKGRTPLHLACQSGTADHVRILLKAGASPHFIDRNGWSPLFDSVRHGRAEMMAAFIDNNLMDLHETGPAGQTPLDMALTGQGAEAALVLKRWWGAKRSGNRWLPKLMTAANDSALAAFRTDLAAMETGFSLRFTPGGVVSVNSNCSHTDIRPLQTLRSQDVIAEAFREHWHRFLNHTGLLIEPSCAAQSLIVIFDDRFAFSGNAAEWAWIQQTWADKTRFMNRRWSESEFFSEGFRAEFQESSQKLLTLLRNRLLPIPCESVPLMEYSHFRRSELVRWILNSVFCQHDVARVLSHCRSLTAHQEPRVRSNALWGLGFIAQIHGALSPEEDLPLIRNGTRDQTADVQRAAYFALDQVQRYLGWIVS